MRMPLSARAAGSPIETWGVPQAQNETAPLAQNSYIGSGRNLVEPGTLICSQKEKIAFQSFFMLMTVQPFFFASS